jgi:hypothetical protein
MLVTLQGLRLGSMISAELGARGGEMLGERGKRSFGGPKSEGRYPTVFDIHLSFLQLLEANYRQKKLWFE